MPRSFPLDQHTCIPAKRSQHNATGNKTQAIDTVHIAAFAKFTQRRTFNHWRHVDEKGVFSGHGTLMNHAYAVCSL